MKNKLVAGLDIGSRSIELVFMRHGEIVESRRAATTFEPLLQTRKLMADDRPDVLVATGYGRKLAGLERDMDVTVSITEIKAYALGAHYLDPKVKTVLDIGGQDTKAISLNGKGGVLKFEMNDRCAAGTGKFLEHLATAFQLDVEAFGKYALGGEKPAKINSMCTVFAETEATSMMANGTNPKEIALGLHHAIAKRSLNMLKRVGLTEPVMFAGGVAKNPCMIDLLKNEFEAGVVIPDNPDMVGALGAAVHACGLIESV